MKPLLFVLATLLLFSCKKDEIVVNNELTHQFSIHSEEKGKPYDIWVKLPKDYHSTSEAYATMYVLDAKQNQELIAETCEELSERLDSKNVIVVGIHYGDNRNVDYTPTSAGMGKGGSLAFMNFICKELIPRIEHDYRADTSRNSRSIIGHSYGGLFGAYAFAKHNEIFSSYLLLSASLFYDESIILQYEQQNRPKLIDNPQLVFLGAGSAENALLPANQLLYQRLHDHYPLAKSSFQLVTGKGHVSSRNRSIQNAINFYFKNR